MLSFWRAGTNYLCPQLRLNSRHTVGLHKGQPECLPSATTPQTKRNRWAMEQEAMPSPRRASQSWDFTGPVAMTTTVLSSFFIQNPRTSPGKIPNSHKWASILSPRQDLNWTSNKKMCTNLSRVLNSAPMLNVIICLKGNKWRPFLKQQNISWTSLDCTIVLVFMHFLKRLHNDKRRKK